MKKVIFDFCTNMGGIRKMFAIPPGSFAGIRHNHTKSLKWLDVVDTDNIIELYCTPDTMNFTEEKTHPVQGALYNITIIGTTPKENPTNQVQFRTLENNYWLVLFIDNNDFLRLAGDTDHYLVFNRTATTGQTGGARNQREFSFTGQLPFECHFIEPDDSMLFF